MKKALPIISLAILALYFALATFTDVAYVISIISRGWDFIDVLRYVENAVFDLLIFAFSIVGIVMCAKKKNDAPRLRFLNLAFALFAAVAAYDGIYSLFYRMMEGYSFSDYMSSFYILIANCVSAGLIIASVIMVGKKEKLRKIFFAIGCAIQVILYGRYLVLLIRYSFVSAVLYLAIIVSFILAIVSNFVISADGVSSPRTPARQAANASTTSQDDDDEVVEDTEYDIE